MGIRSSKLKPEDLEYLKKNTKFTESEIKAWNKQFSRLFPEGRIYKDKLKMILAHSFPFGDASTFAEHTFRTLDTKRDGYIDFPEFLCAASDTLRGKLEHRLARAFIMCDADGNGYITYDEMLAILTAIYEMKGGGKVWPEEESTPEACAQKIFRHMDRDGDGKVSLVDFIEGSKNNPFTMERLEVLRRRLHDMGINKYGFGDIKNK